MVNNENTKKKGLATQTANPKTKTTKINFNDNSSFNQRIKLLDWLFEKGSITTSEARKYLDILSPAPRFFELRHHDGYLINLIWVSWTSEHGIKHRIGRYVLIQKEPLENLELGEVA